MGEETPANQQTSANIQRGLVQHEGAGQHLERGWYYVECDVLLFTVAVFQGSTLGPCLIAGHVRTLHWVRSGV